MALRTDYKNDELNIAVNTERQFEEVTNPNGTKSYRDVTDYSQVGDSIDADLVNSQNAEINAKAPLDSPTFTGTPTAPTQSQSTADDTIATTSYVKSAFNNFIDPNLRTHGKAADAQVTGNRIASAEARIPSVDKLLETDGAAADAKATGEKITEIYDDLSDFYELFDEDVSLTFEETNGYIDSRTGLFVASQNWRSTKYIRIDDYTKLLFSRATSIISPTASFAIVSGVAFFENTMYSTYISSELVKYGANSDGYDVSFVNVPSDAKYVRFSFWADDSLGDVFVRGFKDIVKKIDSINVTVENKIPVGETSEIAGITYNSLGDGKWNIFGTATANSTNSFYLAADAFPNDIKPGGCYQISIDTDGALVPAIGLGVIALNNNDQSNQTQLAYVRLDHQRKARFKVPSDATGIRFFFFIQNGTTIYGTDISTSLFEVDENSDLNDLVDLYAIGLYKTYGNTAYSGMINANLVLNDYNSYCALIPAEGVKSIEIKCNEAARATAIAFLRDIPVMGETIKFTYKRDSEDQIVYEDDAPVENRTRYAIAQGKTRQFTVYDDCKYIYMHGGTLSGPSWYLPDYMSIDGTVIVDTRPVKQATSWHTVFFDDFDGNELSDKWAKIKCSPNNMLTHNSMYYTDDDDCFLSNGCLVMKVMQDPNIDLGGSYQYDPETGEIVVDSQGNPILAPRKFKSPYISTQDKFSMKRGAISARIKLGQPIESSFAWTFFTFSQNAYWPTCPEFDIVEGTIDMLKAPYTPSSGQTYPIGSLMPLVCSHTHFVNKNGNNDVIDGFMKIVCDGDVLFRKFGTFDETEWHVYKVIWDENEISYYIDDMLVNQIDLQALEAQSIWESPADIRLNIKSRPWSDADEAWLVCDWIKAESDDEPQPPIAITHDDITLRVGERYYTRPTIYPSEAQNYSFYISEDPYDVYAKGITDGGQSEDIGLTYLDTKQYVNVNTGVPVNSSNWRSTNYISIDGYRSVEFTKPKSTIASDSQYAVVAGVSFYTDATYETFISGERITYGSADDGYEVATVSVPAGAQYAKFTFWANEQIGNPVTLETYMPDYEIVWHRLYAASVGEAHITMTTGDGNVVGTFKVTVTS